MSLVLFENVNAYVDTDTFFCQHIAKPADGDYCKASMRIIDRRTCKVEVIREFRATYGEGRGREFMLAKEVFTFADIDLNRVKPVLDTQKHTARLKFEGDVEIFRHEGYQYSFDLDGKGNYSACRVNGVPQSVPEDECVRRGTQTRSTSTTMSLLFNGGVYQEAIQAVDELQHVYCPIVGLKL